MGPALFAITLEAMKSEVDEVALQGKIQILLCQYCLKYPCNYNKVIYMPLNS